MTAPSHADTRDARLYSTPQHRHVDPRSRPPWLLSLDRVGGGDTGTPSLPADCIRPSEFKSTTSGRRAAPEANHRSQSHPQCNENHQPANRGGKPGWWESPVRSICTHEPDAYSSEVGNPCLCFCRRRLVVAAATTDSRRPTAVRGSVHVHRIIWQCALTSSA